MAASQNDLCITRQKCHIMIFFRGCSMIKDENYLKKYCFSYEGMLKFGSTQSVLWCSSCKIHLMLQHLICVSGFLRQCPVIHTGNSFLVLGIKIGFFELGLQRYDDISSFCYSVWYSKRGFCNLYFYVHISALLHLLPLRFHCSLTTRLDLIHTRLDLIHTRLHLIHTRLDLIHTQLDLIHARLDLIHTWLDLIHTRLDLIQIRLDFIHTWLDLIYTWQDLIHARKNLIHTRLDLIHTRQDLIHTRLDHPRSTRSHRHPARYHLCSARSHQHLARSHLHSARTHPNSATFHIRLV